MNPGDASPRINGELLPQYIGIIVRLVGRIATVDYNSGIALIVASDNVQIKVKMHPESIERQGYSAKIVEVIGKVNPDQSLSEFAVIPFTDTFGKINHCVVNLLSDLANYEAMLRLMQVYKPLFL
jgi:hypothetical protein